MFNLN